MIPIARTVLRLARLAVILFALNVMGGCTRTLNVRVIDAETGDALPDAVVMGNVYSGFFAMAAPEAHTDADGVARLRGPARALRRLSARAPSYGGSGRVQWPRGSAADTRADATIVVWRRPLFTVEYRLPTGYRGVVLIRRYAGELPAVGRRHVVVPINPPDVAQDPTGGVEVDSAGMADGFHHADGSRLPLRDLSSGDVGLRADEAFYKAFARPQVGGEELRVFFIGTEPEMRAVTEAATAR